MTRFPRPRRSAPHAPLLLGLLLLALLAVSVPSTAAAPPTQDLSQWRTYANGDDIWSMAFEGSTVVWAGTRGGGVIRWDVSDLNAPTPTQYLFPQDRLAGNVVRSVVVDDRGNKWFATDRGLSRLTSGGEWTTFTRASTGGKLASDTVTALAMQGTTLWVGSQQFWSPADKKWIGGGFARVDTAAEPPVWQTAWSADETPDRVASNNVTDIAVDGTNGDVWVTMRTDLENISPPPNRPNVYTRSRFGGITVVHSDLTLEKFQRNENDASAWPKSDSFLTVAIDATGLKWFGSGDLTQGGVGVHVLKGNSLGNAQWRGLVAPGSNLSTGMIAVTGMPAGANRIPNITTSIQDRMWVSLAGVDADVDRGEGMGVCLMAWDRNFETLNAPTCQLYDTTGGTSNLPALPGNMVRALLQDTTRGLALFGTGGRLPPPDGSLYPQGSDGHGIGLLVFSPPRMVKLLTFGLTPSSNHLNAVGVKADGTIWAGNAYPTGGEAWGGKGLDILGQDSRWGHETIGSDTSQAISSLAFDDKGRLWVGMFRQQKIDGSFVEGGVAVDKQPWVVYQQGSALPSNSISAVGAVGSRVWVGTGNGWPPQHGSRTISAGLAVYDTASETWGTPIQAPTLLENEVTDIAGANGQTWIANTGPSVGSSEFLPGGLTVNDGTNWTSIPAGQNGLTFSGNDPRAVYAAADGTVWAGGYFSTRPQPDPILSDAIINWRLPGATDWQRVTFKEDGWVSAIVRRAKGNGSIWLGTTRGGLDVEDMPARVFPAGQGNQYNAKGGLRVYANNTWSEFHPDNSPLVSAHINALAVDDQDNLWIATTMGLMRYSGDVPNATIVPPTPPATFTPSPPPPPTATPLPTTTPVMFTPAPGGSAPTLTPSVPTPTPTLFPGSPPPEIPEASTLWLLGSGLAGLAGYIRFFARRRR